MDRRRAVVAVAVLATVAFAASLASWAAQRPSASPDEALGPPVARAAPVPGGASASEPGRLFVSPWIAPRGGDCEDLDRVGGRLHLCWEVARFAREEGPFQDYFALRVGATFAAAPGSAERAVLQADLVGDPSNRVFEGWPDGEHEGPCESVPVSLALTELTTDVLCGRTTGASEPDRWIHTALWSCAPCSRIEAADRALALWVWVAVPERSTPAWDVYADLTP